MAVSYPPPSGVKRDVDQTLPENPSTVKQPSEIEVICELENTVMVKYSSRTEDGSKVDNNFKVNYRPNVEDSSKSEDLSQADESFMAGNYSDVENHSKVEDLSKIDLPHVESSHTKSDEFLMIGVCYKTGFLQSRATPQSRASHQGRRAFYGKIFPSNRRFQQYELL